MSDSPGQNGDLREALGIPWRGEFPHPTLVMGIVNATPDSFQTEGRHPSSADAAAHARRLVCDGADILDIGGESTRPGSRTVPPEEECARVIPVIEALSGLGLPVSVDTRKAEVARRAVAAGARIINDVSAGRYDPAILEVAASSGAFLCLMHAPLDPGSMGWSTGNNPTYADVVAEVRDDLAQRAEIAVAAGVARARIWLDPGFGFGKSIHDNLAILRRLDEIVALGYPVLIGTSRKSTLGKVLGGAPPEERVEATMATVALAIAAGAAVVRVHDVAAAVRVARTTDAFLHSHGA